MAKARTERNMRVVSIEPRLSIGSAKAEEWIPIRPATDRHFAMSEGLIASLKDIKCLSACPDNPKLVQVQLHYPAAVKIGRKNVVINSSCGICGAREILQDNALQLSPAEDNLRLQRRKFVPLMEQTGGSHATAIFEDSGKVLAVAENLGRHNTMDKAIGIVLLQRGNVNSGGVVLSSRPSLEMVLKAVRPAAVPPYGPGAN